MIRQPAVAGTFYPINKDELLHQLRQMIPTQSEGRSCLGLISPHAGYIFSGAIAGRLFAETALPEQVIVLGPNHHGIGAEAAIYSEGHWQTPLGQVPIAQDLADHLKRHCALLQDDLQAHRMEHSIEVQIPFLQYLQPELRIVPICLGSGGLEDWMKLGSDIGQALTEWPSPVLIVASSDMNHFLDAGETRRRDRLAIDAVLALDPVLLYRTVRDNHISMCGVIPSVVMLQAALAQGATECRLVRYGHSGEVNGDLSRVVGYAALAVS